MKTSHERMRAAGSYAIESNSAFFCVFSYLPDAVNRVLILSSRQRPILPPDYNPDSTPSPKEQRANAASSSFISQWCSGKMPVVSHVTHILQSYQASDPKLADELLSVVYSELRRLAAAKMTQEPAGQTLQATALVHEAWLRLADYRQPRWENRAHFFSAASEAMRRILVENARRKLRQKRGGGLHRIELEESAIVAPAEDEKVVQVHDALDALAREDPQKAEIVKLRFFVGLGNDEIAALLGVNEKTVRRHWDVAKVRLFQSIKAAK